MNKDGLGRTQNKTRKVERFFENEIENLWRYREVAKFFGVSVRTISRRVKTNTIPYTSVGDAVRFCPWVIRSWAENGGSL